MAEHIVNSDALAELSCDLTKQIINDTDLTHSQKLKFLFHIGIHAIAAGISMVRSLNKEICAEKGTQPPPERRLFKSLVQDLKEKITWYDENIIVTNSSTKTKEKSNDDTCT